MPTPAYIQHPGKVVAADDRFKHVMAVTLDPSSKPSRGIIRCITSRSGEIGIKGNLDRSELHLFTGESLEHFLIGERLQIKNSDQIIDSLTQKGWDFIGLEDPDIFIDGETGLVHVYFTIPIKPPKGTEKVQIHLGHAFGKDIDSLKMTMPALLDEGIADESAKEVSIAPRNSNGIRLNLIESRDRRPEDTYSIVKVAIAEDMGGKWRYGQTVFHPADHHIPWIGGHASPGPLLPRSFIDLGPNKLLGIMNGREANQKADGKTKYGIFSVGLFVYDYEEGKIDWVSPEPLIRDTEAVTITFASQFVETGPGKGILYAHVDDSFVRAYTLNAEAIKELLP